MLSICSTLSSCSAILGVLESRTEEKLDFAKKQNKVEEFQDLLKQGWEIFVHDDKVILIKQTPDGTLVNDVFSLLNEE